MPTRKGTFVCVALAALAGTARAQSQRILGREDAAFARGLFTAGYVDLAEGVCKVVNAANEKGEADFYQVLEITALSFDLRLERAGREPDLLKRRDLIVEVLGAENAFIEANSRTKTAEDVRNGLPEVYLRLGETLVSALENEQDPAKLAQLRDDGKKYFEQALQSQRERIKKFDEQKSDANVDSERVELQHMVAMYNLARTLYYQSRLLTPDDPQRKKLLEAAREAFQEFTLFYEDTQLNYNGLVYQGLASLGLGDVKDALSCFDDAIALRETYTRGADGRYDTDTGAADIVSSAVLQKILVFKEQKDLARVEATAKDFFATIPDADQTAQGLAVLSEQAYARLAAGNSTGANELGQRLIDLDPEGPWGANGRDILSKSIGRSGGVDAAGLLRLAETLMGRNDLERALDVCQIALRNCKGDASEANNGAQALLLVGWIYAREDRWHEASVAWDAATEAYPTGAQAGEAMYRAHLAYKLLNERERRSFYDKRATERLRTLATRYPKHPYAYKAQLIEGDALEDKGQWQDAMALYRKIAPGTSGHEEAQFRIGRCLLSLARAAASGAGKPEAAAEAYKQAEEQLRLALRVIEEGIGKTLDRAVQQALLGQLFAARSTLAQLLLETKRGAEVQALLADAEQRFGQDAESMAAVWTFRIQALQAEGKLDEAVSLFEALLQKQSDAPGISNAAGVLARALDQAGVDVLEKEPKSKRCDELWAKAAHYYMLSVRPQLADAGRMRMAELEEIARRMYVFGMHFNGVPEDASTFVDWDGKATDPEPWKQAARIYEAMLVVAPSYQLQISLGRTYGFLQRWVEAEQVYARLFDQESLISPTSERFNANLVRAKPELVYAFLEWAVAEHRLALEDKQADRFKRAEGLLERMLKNTQIGERLWWQAKYHQIGAMLDRGEYDKADIATREVKRSTSLEFDAGKYGFQPKFKELEAELSKKVFKK